MHLRLYRSQDADAIAAIKARCDLADPLTMYYRHSSSSPVPQNKDDEDKWRAHVKSTRRSLRLGVLLPGVVCWVLVLDDDDVEAANIQHQQDNIQRNSGNDESVVGFAIWTRHGSSDTALQWRGAGRNLTTRVKLGLAQLNLSLKYPFDPSIDRARMARFMRHLKSGPSSAPGETERWELEAMYIHPLYQRRGFGGRALQWGVDRAREEGVQIWVWSTEAGKSLYLKHGFGEVGRVDFSDMVPNTPGVTVTVMAWGDG